MMLHRAVVGNKHHHHEKKNQIRAPFHAPNVAFAVINRRQSRPQPEGVAHRHRIPSACRPLAAPLLAPRRFFLRVGSSSAPQQAKEPGGHGGGRKSQSAYGPPNEESRPCRWRSEEHTSELQSQSNL